LQGRYIATLATHNAFGSIHLAAVWFLWDGSSFLVSTYSTSRKARNVLAHPQASIMIDVRKAGAERGLCASGPAEMLSGEESRQINLRVHQRYMSEAAMADQRVGPVMNELADVTFRIKPTSWVSWDMRLLDAQVFSGLLGSTPGYLLPLDT